MSEQTARFVRVGKVSDVPPDRAEVFDVEERRIAMEGDQVICPRHGARFSIKSGAALTFPAVSPVETYPVRVDGEDLFVGIAE